MLETHLNSPVARRRLRTGPAADHIDSFADWLHLYGYRPTSINNLLRSLAAWTDWMLAAGFTAQEFLVGFEACKLAVEQKQRVLYALSRQGGYAHILKGYFTPIWSGPFCSRS